MQINIPDQVIIPELVNQIVSSVLNSLESKISLLNKSSELPPYPNKTQVKQVLGIGDRKLDSWIANGLRIQIWSKQDIRIDRNELQRFLKENFEA
ncbi:hypothetical protein EM4838_02955 [Enterococcus mundtii]|uniref:DNA-binding protein n=1 Tax=Enterococcus mundtii TaxID=53346 RepID=A0ABQ0VE16_ENTMU|nr:hypothetical protein [Enterococcus mundtii]AUB51998.1 hypothetical protein EM4838_02955 [Enterococcus mundtii]GEL80799.1 hypothetical protein EMU01_19430 [Enterococcus mundtii]GEN18788.1 hypothetical protein LAC02_20690 [Ligilactobacillus acidipiscis]